MRTVFADTFYWIALASPLDEWHSTARELSAGLQPARIFTTDEVLAEFLTWFSSRGAENRLMAVRFLRKVQNNPNITVWPQTRESFQRGVQLYESRADKDYSLTDCISMGAMRSHGLQEVLTHDHHFTQEGFTILFADNLK